MEHLLKLLNWLSSIFTKSTEPYVAEYRWLQRNWLLSQVVMVVSLLLYVVIQPTPPDNPNMQIVESAISLVSGFLLVVAAGCVVWVAWAIYALWQLDRGRDD